MSVPVVSAHEVAAGAIDRFLTASDPVGGAIVLDLDTVLDDDDDDAARAAERIGSSGRIVIGFSVADRAARGRTASSGRHALESACATSVVGAGPVDHETIRSDDPVADLERILEAIAGNPLSSAILADTLRITAALPVDDALVAESLAYSTLLAGSEFAGWLAKRTPTTPSAATGDAVLLERSGSILRLTLNRPERRNAYSARVRDELVAGLTIALADSSIERVLVSGIGPAFCSGGDLAEFGTVIDPPSAHLVRSRAGAGALIHSLGDRIEFRVHGACVGAGAELTALASRVIAADDVTFRLPEVAMGLIPGAGGTVGIPKRIGRWRTFFMGVTGTPVTAQTALNWGLIDEIDSAVGAGNADRK
jgi:enoyl-CoA hydratase/carnithine racemase